MGSQPDILKSIVINQLFNRKEDNYGAYESCFKECCCSCCGEWIVRISSLGRIEASIG